MYFSETINVDGSTGTDDSSQASHEVKLEENQEAEDRYDPSNRTSRKLENYWMEKTKELQELNREQLRAATRTQQLPLTRVKKIMKIDDQVKRQMISGDVPLLLSVAAEMLCQRLTIGGWKYAEAEKRKTLTKADVAKAIAADDKMDFLIDIVPRPEKPAESEKP